MSTLDKFAFALTLITESLKELRVNQEHPLYDTITEIAGHAHKFTQIVDEILQKAPRDLMTSPMEEFHKLEKQGNIIEAPSLAFLEGR